MSFSSGTFSINSAGQPVVTGTVISSTAFNALTADLATGLSTCLLKDGTQTVTGNIPMSTFKITGLGSATARTDAASIANIQDGTGVYVSTVGGTANAITLTPSPAITVYTSGQKFSFIASGANSGAVTVAINGLTAKAITKNGTVALVTGDIPSGALISIEYDGTQFQLSGVIGIPVTLVTAKGDLIAATASGVVARVAVGQNGQFLQSDSTQTAGIGWATPAKTCEGRLTLTTGTAVTTSDVTAATTVYFTPYKGDKISLYDSVNTVWRTYSFTELSIAVPATTTTMYDVFVYDNAGTLTLDATAWTNDTTRATALALQNGAYVKTGATSRLYVGSFRTTGVSGQTEDSIANRFVWNYYNRVIRRMKAVESTASWNYTTTSFRQANASTSNQLNLIIGVTEDSVEATVLAVASGSAGSLKHAVGIGLDSTTVNSADLVGYRQTEGTGTNDQTTAHFNSTIAVGKHSLVWLELGDTTITFAGTGGVSYIQSGIIGTLLG